MSSKQVNIFLESEGNQWFCRNRDSIKSANGYFETNFIKQALTDFKNEINCILEVGSGNGAKLSDLCNFFGVDRGRGIDPSKEATLDGNSRFSNIHLEQGIASELPFEDNHFDLVYVGFCTYLIDRGDLFRVVSEIDRVLRPGGFVAIHDFDPIYRHKRPYHHKEGLFSYKTSNSQFFTTSGHYYLVAKYSMSLEENHFQLDGDQRVSICLLHKELDPYPLILDSNF